MHGRPSFHPRALPAAVVPRGGARRLPHHGRAWATARVCLWRRRQCAYGPARCPHAGRRSRHSQGDRPIARYHAGARLPRATSAAAMQKSASIREPAEGARVCRPVPEITTGTSWKFVGLGLAGAVIILSRDAAPFFCWAADWAHGGVTASSDFRTAYGDRRLPHAMIAS
jgi:hypothetical protein